MPDTLAFLLLVALFVGGIGMCVVAALLAIAAVRCLCGAARRAVATVRTHRRREELVQLLADPDAAYLPCHSLVCGHLHTIHVPDKAGVLVCEGCGTPAVS
ncbi:hypothetical protein AB0903_31140 [Streptomyces sp. NPDC048389]|uniref:hypothetical protein n=1 Tax=Streptomyces sp. NPDC048389 TaxID=3154622 RepID=UPI0034554333